MELAKWQEEKSESKSFFLAKLVCHPIIKELRLANLKNLKNVFWTKKNENISKEFDIRSQIPCPFQNNFNYFVNSIASHFWAGQLESFSDPYFSGISFPHSSVLIIIILCGVHWQRNKWLSKFITFNGCWLFVWLTDPFIIDWKRFVKKNIIHFICSKIIH